MDSGKKHKKPPNPRASANPLSSLTFAWTLPIFWLGFKREMEMKDLSEPLPEHSSGPLGDKFSRLWCEELERFEARGRRPSLLRVIMRAYGWKCIMYGFVLFIMECFLRIQQPIFLGLLIRYFDQPRYGSTSQMLSESPASRYTQDTLGNATAHHGDVSTQISTLAQPIVLGRLISYYTPRQTAISKDEAYMYAGAVVLCSAVNIFFVHPYMMGIVHMGMKFRVACCSLIYRKSLRLSRTALGETTVGQVVNLLSNDVNRFDVAVIFMHYLWIGPLETIIITYLMWQEIGFSAVVGVAFMLAFIPLQAWLGRQTSVLRLRTALRTDERVRLMSEIISGIQVIKMYTWEGPFADMVATARKREIKQIRATSYIRGVLTSFMMFITRVSLFCSILSYVLFGGDITAEKVFVITSYYSILRQAMTVFFPQGIAQVAEANISVKRLQKFMMFEETSKPVPPLTESYAEKRKPKKKEEKFKHMDRVISHENGKLSNEFSAQMVAIDGTIPEKDSSNGKSPELLEEDDIQSKQEELEEARRRLRIANSNTGITLTGVCAKWEHTHVENTLNNIDLKVKPGCLVAVIGPVGSGKSSILNAILKELPLLSGTLEVGGTVSYASQEPWLFAGSVRQNILFGAPMDRPRYNLVVRRCALDRDFQLLPYGDRTVVGERGFSLSGGQRARISLARCVYRRAAVYLLDDPLSAVDTAVGRHLFDSCIIGHLRDTTRILVTHQLQYLKDVDHIVILKNGSIAAQGNYATLIASGLDFAALLKEGNESNEFRRSESLVSQPVDDDSAVISASGSFRQRQMSVHSMGSVDDVAAGIGGPAAEEGEGKSSGAVSGKVYSAYFLAAGSPFVLFIMAVVLIVSQIAGSGADYWTSYWVNLEEEYNYGRISKGTYFLNATEEYKDLPPSIFNSSIQDTYKHFNDTDFNGFFFGMPLNRNLCIYIYTGIVVALIVITLSRAFMFFFIAMRASTRLHNGMFRAITRAPMRFFHTNPSGRILNRFSKDMGAVDEMLPSALIDVLQIGLSLIGIVIVVAIVNYWLLVPTFFIGFIFYLLRIVYLRTSRSVKRLEGTTRSPVFSHLSASLQGMTTIRAFGAQEALIKEFDNHQDLHSSAWYLFIASSRAFGFWLDVVCVVYIAFVTMSFLVFGNDDYGGNVGLAITQAMGLTGMFQWGMRQSTELENQMTSVERIQEYTEIDSEPPLESTPQNKPQASWPQNGELVFRRVYLKYNPDDQPVLKNLSFVIPPGEKVGIVGRTGAGKSSLINALFRLAYIEGNIIIDNVDASRLGLHDLRSRISIIPQEPVLFSGTMRHNLDPFDEYSDDILWDALEQVELKEAVMELAAGLSSKMSEGGSNFSVGQRQLVCLARAIVRRNRVLVLDEATANVDPQTDALIQMTIRRKFSDCTVMTIAHRLHTVMDSDKVLVMDAGTMVEFDHPHILLQNEDGILRSMVNQTGKAMTETLLNVAKTAFESGHTDKLQ